MIGAILAFAAVFIARSCEKEANKKQSLEANSQLIQQQIRNTSKLVVSEGHFSEVFNFSDSKEILGTLFTADKKALVVVNAEVTIAYDLKAIEFKIDEAAKTLYIQSLPEPELKINPDFHYYDVTADYFNKFTAEDYNSIKNKVNSSLADKIATSSLKSNAENRLITELSKFYILTNTLGWNLVYEENKVHHPTDFNFLE